MKNRPIFFITFIVSCVICASSYGDSLNIGDRARLGGVYSLERLQRYAQAIPIITDLYKRYPHDLEIKWTYARVLGFGGHWKEAVNVLDELCVNGCSKNEWMIYAHILEAQGSDPEVLSYMKRLADSHKDLKEIQSIYINMLVWNKQSPSVSSSNAGMKTSPSTTAETLIAQQKYDQALVQLEIILKASPDDENALLWKARLLSWQGEKVLSIKFYQRLIQEYPSKVLYYRECARVMGWAGLTKESASLYKEACQLFPQDQALNAEARAKTAYYNNSYFQAERAYRQWLALEPDNPEALFDLGQIYARSGHYAAAMKDYAEILYKSPNNPQAMEAFEQARVYDKDWLIDSGFLHDEANSKARQVDYRLYDAYEQLEKSFLGNMVFSIRTDEMDYSFPGPLSNVQRYRYMGYVEQDLLPDTFWKLGYGLSDSSDDDKQLQYRYAEAQFPIVTERLLLDISYNRDDFIQNEAMLAEHLQQDQYRARATWSPTVLPLVFGADEDYSHFTDSNRLNDFGGDVAWNLLNGPERLTVKYRWQDWRFAEIEPDYFSPANFPSQRVSVEWEQFLNKNDLFWGANNFSYFLRYEFINDQGNQRGNGATAGINWHINKRLTMRVQAQHISYDHPGIYKDDEQTISLIIAF